MPTIIFDDAAMELAMSQLGGRPVYAAPDGSFLKPGVMDLGNDDVSGRWAPANTRARCFVLADQACRDLVDHGEQFIASPEQRSRVAKRMTIATCNLMDLVYKQLIPEDNKPDARAHRGTWPRVDQTTYREVAKRLRVQRIHGPVRQIRNKLTAHLDVEAVDNGGLRLKTEDLLGAIGDSLVLLAFGMRQPASAFAWIRGIARSTDGSQHAVETMFDYPICVRWITDAEGHVKHVEGVRFAEDPRHELTERILAAAEMHNRMADAIDSDILRIWWRDTEQVRAEEAAAGET